jgi:hypothetical protein
LPAAPALCLLCARAWSDARGDAASPRHSATRVGRYLIGPILLAAGIVLGYLLIARFDLAPGAFVMPVALTLAGGAATVALAVRRTPPPRIPWLVTIVMLILYAGVIVFVLPALEQRKVIPAMAEWVASRADADDRLASFRLNRWNPAYRFYVGRHI